MKLILAGILLLVTVQSCTSQLRTSLHYLSRPADQNLEKPPLIILLHGIGSNEEDLFSLSSLIPKQFLFVSARAPITLQEGSYAWYEMSLTGGKPVYNSEQLISGGKLIVKFIEELKSIHKFDHDRIFLIGFSQGAIMSYHVGLTNPGMIHGVAALSGRLAAESRSLAKESKTKGLPEFFISHGTMDNVLPVTYAREAKQFLEVSGIQTLYREYEEVHTINQSMLHDLIGWLNSIDGFE